MGNRLHRSRHLTTHIGSTLLQFGRPNLLPGTQNNKLETRPAKVCKIPDKCSDVLLLNVCLANGRAIIVPSTTVLDSNHRKFEKASLTNTEIQRTHRGSSGNFKGLQNGL